MARAARFRRPRRVPARHQGSAPAGLPFYVGGEEAFCAREWTAPPQQGDFGVLDRQALEEGRLTVTFAERPSLVADHAFTTGQVPEVTFEQVLSPSKMKVGIETGTAATPTGCRRVSAARRRSRTSSGTRSRPPTT